MITITSEKQIADFLLKNEFYQRPITLNNITKPTHFGESIFIARLKYQPKIEKDVFGDNSLKYQKVQYFLSFEVAPSLVFRYITQYFKNETNHDFSELVKRKLRGTNQYQFIPYTQFDFRDLNHTNGPTHFLPGDSQIHVITDFDNTTGQFVTEGWQLDLGDDEDLAFILRDLNNKYYQRLARLEKEQKQVRKIKRDINNDFRLINKYFDDDEKQKLIKRLLR